MRRKLYKESSGEKTGNTQNSGVNLPRNNVVFPKKYEAIEIFTEKINVSPDQSPSQISAAFSTHALAASSKCSQSSQAYLYPFPILLQYS